MERRGPLPGDGNDHNYYYGGGGGGYYYYPTYDPFYYGYYDPFYYGYRYGYSPYWVPGYGFGLGYFAYDPFLFGGYAYGAPYPYSYGTPDPASVYGGAYSGGSSSSYRAPVGTGSLRLKIKPGNAQVFVDGYYVGLVESFDGVFQKLEVEAGTHKVEIKAEGFKPEVIDVVVKPGETAAYKGDLKKVQ